MSLFNKIKSFVFYLLTALQIVLRQLKGDRKILSEDRS